jgi:hypothetical protein
MGFTKCHFCGRLASARVYGWSISVYSKIWRARTGPRCPIPTCVDVQFQPASVWWAHSGPRCSISTCFWRARFGPRCSCVWRAPSGPDVQFQLLSGELIPGPDFRCLNFRLASSSRAQMTLVDLRRTRWRMERIFAGRGRRLPPRSSAASAFRRWLLLRKSRRRSSSSNDRKS